MTQLDVEAARGLAGDDPADVDQARQVEEITPRHVAAAEQAVTEAEAKAEHSEAVALEGGSAAQAAADREGAKYAGLRLAVTRRRAGRRAAAQRILALDAIGGQAQEHAQRLAQVREQVAGHVAEIDRHAAAARDLCRAWNGELMDLIGQAEAYAPEKPAPGMVPHASSGGVYASSNGTPPAFVAKGTVLRPVNLQDTPEVHGLDEAIGAAVSATRQHGDDARLVIHPSGLVTPYPADPYGHTARRLERGEARELDAAERARYLAGERVAF